MIETIPQTVYESDGPFVTVYLDASRTTESGAHEVELRWRGIRSQLEADGARSDDLAALDRRVADDAGTPGPHGLVLVAADGQLVFDATLPDPPRREGGRVDVLPDLVPFLAQQARHVPHVLVVADRTGADVVLSLSATETEREQVQGPDQYPVHKTVTADRSSWGFENRVEESWASNAREVAEHVAGLVARHPVQLIVLAGEETARGEVRDALVATSARTVPLTEVAAGGRSPDGSDEALAAAERDAVLAQVWAERREVLEHLRQNLGRGRFAVAGVAPVVDALRQAKVDTVVLSDEPSSPLTAAVGPRPTDLALDEADLKATGVDHPRRTRLDAALLRAAVGTGASMVVTPGGHDYVAEGVGALLRHDP